MRCWELAYSTTCQIGLLFQRSQTCLNMLGLSHIKAFKIKIQYKSDMPDKYRIPDISDTFFWMVYSKSFELSSLISDFTYVPSDLIYLSRSLVSSSSTSCNENLGVVAQKRSENRWQMTDLGVVAIRTLISTLDDLRLEPTTCTTASALQL